MGFALVKSTKLPVRPFGYRPDMRMMLSMYAVLKEDAKSRRN